MVSWGSLTDVVQETDGGSYQSSTGVKNVCSDDSSGTAFHSRA